MIVVVAVVIVLALVASCCGPHDRGSAGGTVIVVIICGVVLVPSMDRVMALEVLVVVVLGDHAARSILWRE